MFVVFDGVYGGETVVVETKVVVCNISTGGHVDVVVLSLRDVEFVIGTLHIYNGGSIASHATAWSQRYRKYASRLQRSVQFMVYQHESQT